MSTFKSVGRYFQSLDYKVSGLIDKLSDDLRHSPEAMGAIYDENINSKQSQVQENEAALTRLKEIKKQKTQELKKAESEVERLTSLRDGSLQCAQARADELGSPEACRDDAQFKNFHKAYKDFDNSLDVETESADKLKADLEASEECLQEHLDSLKELIASIEKLNEEKTQALATIADENKLTDFESGSVDSVSRELKDLRQKLEARKRLDKELAGDGEIDDSAVADIQATINKNDVDAEFEALIDFSKSKKKKKK